MTSTTDTAEHPDVAEISDLTEGLLPPSRTAEVRRHLDACELCADVYASLEEIRGLLGTLPGPPRMPTEIAGRIDAALAAEALLGATAPESLTPTAAPTLVGASRDGSDEIGEDAEHPGAHVSRETSPTTTAARPSGHSRAATGPGRKDRKDRSRGGRRGRIVLGAVFTAAVLGAGALFIQSLGDHNTSDTAQGNATSSADTFSKAKLETVVSDLLSSKASTNQGTGSTGSMKPWNAESDPGTDTGSSTGSSSKTPKTLIEPSAPVPDCIRQGIDRGNTDVLGFKEGTYNGSAAYLAVLPDASDSSQVTAYVVDATCVSHHTSTPGKVLLTRSYPRS
ncbi:hypothetical protein [Streptomyces sp. NPDC091219]|uniref:anti-sigma factor family protein n=1 Tax=Streptomyces sp. NPDC091219 TaxID=3155193 RepID=UPI003450666D